MARVIIAKKIVRTRSENSPTASDRTNDSASAPTGPTARLLQFTPSFDIASATP